MIATSAATKRLMRDIREWKLCCHQAPSISAAPLEHDIFEWHINFCPRDGALKDICFHLVMTFPPNYPLKYPSVAVQHYLHHPNVFDQHICLDMLQDHGWSAAYSVSSVLFQLLSFLITKKAPQDYGGYEEIIHSPSQIDSMYNKSLNHRCRTCGHSYTNPWPELNQYEPPKPVQHQPVQYQPVQYQPVQYQANNTMPKWIPVDKTKLSNTNRKQKRKRNRKKNKKKAKSWTPSSPPTNDDDEKEEKVTIKNGKTHSNGKQKHDDDDDYKQNTNLKKSVWSKNMHVDVENIVIDFLLINDVLNLSRVCTAFKKMVNGSKYVQMERFSCWFHRISLRYCEYIRTNRSKKINDEIATRLLLGYGIIPHFYANDKRIFSTYFNEFKTKSSLQELANDKSLIFPTLEKCDTTLDLLSSDAFHNYTIRRTPRGDKKFRSFIPMYIVHNGYHGRESLSKLSNFVLNIYKSHNENIKKYHPMMSIHLICNIMNSLIVSLMHGYKASKLHKSIAALETFYHYYHLLLAVYFDHYDVLEPLINQKCRNFVENINRRSKKYVPNLGEILIWFLLTEDISTKQIFRAYIQESFCRRVKWLVKDFGAKYETQDIDNFDIQTAFDSSSTSLGLLMFQYYFFNECCGIGIVSAKQKFNELNKNLGCVSSEVSLKLQRFCYDIEKIKSWPQFFNAVNIEYPGLDIMRKWLKTSIYIAAKRGYHRSALKDEIARNRYLQFYKAVATNNIEKVKTMLHFRPTKKEKKDKKMKSKMMKKNIKKVVIAVDDDEKEEKIDKFAWIPMNINQELEEDVDYEYDVNMTNVRSRTPLFVAGYKCYLEMVKILMSRNFNANVVDVYGKKAYDAALEGQNKNNANEMDQIIKLFLKQMKQQQRIELRENKMRYSKENTFSSKYLRIKGLPNKINKNDIKTIFKRYRFTSPITDDCIWFKQYHILVKIRGEIDINEKMKSMNGGYCLGHAINVDFNRLRFDENIQSNNTLLCHGFDIIGGAKQRIRIKKELENLFPNSFDIRVGVNRFNEPEARIRFKNESDSIESYKLSQSFNSPYKIDNNLLNVQYLQSIKRSTY